LDLQGGTHLILQVQVNEAVGLQTDQTLDHLATQLRDKNIRYDELRKVSDTQILVHNLAPDGTSTKYQLPWPDASTVLDDNSSVAGGKMPPCAPRAAAWEGYGLGSCTLRNSSCPPA